MASSVNQTVRLPRWRRAASILPPVGHPMPLFRDVVAAIGIGFERQDWDPGVLRMEAGSSHVGPHSRTVAHGRRATAQPWPADPTESCSRKGYGVLRYRAQGAAQLVHATRSRVVCLPRFSLSVDLDLVL